jgi:hypothetical protein
MIGCRDFDTISQAMDYCHDWGDANKFQIVGVATNLMGTPKLDGSISWVNG